MWYKQQHVIPSVYQEKPLFISKPKIEVQQSNFSLNGKCFPTTGFYVALGETSDNPETLSTSQLDSLYYDVVLDPNRKGDGKHCLS